MSPPTLMAREAMEAPGIVLHQSEATRSAIAHLAARLHRSPPRLIITLARGSSDHAATYGRYLFETLCGIPTSSLSPSLASVYDRPLALNQSLCLAVSQSGKSPDLIAGAKAANQGGALVVAITNTPDSPLTHVADICLALSAGPERSVAATKTFIATLALLARIAAALADHRALLTALHDLPARLTQAAAQDWDPARTVLGAARNLYIVGRGVGLGIAQEAALKFKETCRLHAEAFSGAELMHGPLALIGPGFPVLMFRQDDATAPGLAETAGVLRDKGAALYVAEAGPHQSGRLPVAGGLHPALSPIVMIQSFYGLVERVARDRGLDPDHPPHLRKVTETA